MIPSDDGLFGPQLPGSFDFTLAFEHIVFTIIPAFLFLLAATNHLHRLRRKHHNDALPRDGVLYWGKMAASVLLALLQLALLVLWTMQPLKSQTQRALAVAASVLSLAASVLLVLLSDLAHRSSLRPSLLLGGALLLSAALDLAQARSLFLRSAATTSNSLRPLAAIFAVSLATKIALVVLEEIPKLRVPVPHNKEAFKRPPPEHVGGTVTRTLLWWLNTLFLTGYRRLFGMSDLLTISPKFDSAQLVERIEPFWERRKLARKGRNENREHWPLIDERKEPFWQRWKIWKGGKGDHDLCFATMHAMAWQVLVAVVPRLALVGFTFSQPLLMGRVIRYVEEASSGNGNVEIARSLIGATVLVYAGIAVSKRVCDHLTYQLITMVRGALVGLIFKKTLALPTPALADGASLTLMSTDIESLERGFMMLHDTWACVLEIGLGLFLLWREVGVPFFLVVFPILISTGLNEMVAGKVGPAKMAWNQGVQERVSATSSMLGQIKGIKMMGLSPFFSDYIQGLRQREINLSLKFRYAIVLLEVIGGMVDTFTPIVVITGAVFWKHRGDEALPIAEAFVSVAIVGLVTKPLSYALAARALIAGAMASFTRIQVFLNQDARHDFRMMNPCHYGKEAETEKGANIRVRIAENTGCYRLGVVHMRDAAFQTWGKEAKVLLKNVNLVVKAGTLHMITGGVGSGKSTVLQAILGELATGGIENGNSVWVQVKSIAYCSQTPWLCNLSIRDNIVGASEFEFDEAWYWRVLRACALDRDFTGDDWDLNTVGSGGLILSGGQKQRVALARAVYSRKLLLLLDDVFSGLDHKTSGFVFRELLGKDGLLRVSGQTVVMTTNQTHLLPYADSVSTVEAGTLVSVEKEALLSTIRVDSVSESQSSSDREEITPPATSTGDGQTKLPAKDEGLNDLNRAAGDTSLYKYYLMSVGWPITAIFLLLALVSAGLEKMPQVWLKIWTGRGTDNNTGLYYGLYVTWAALGFVSTMCFFIYYFVVFIPKSSKHLHDVILDTVLKAPLHFFTTVDSGVTLNRFSQDLTLIDQRLPMTLFGTLFFFLSVVSGGIIIATGAQYTSAIIPFAIVVLYFIQKFYLRTSRQMRFLDLEAKSPLYTHFTETLAGAVTIRAFGWEQAFLAEHRRRLDLSQKPFYLMYCLQVWLGLVLDLLVTAIAVALVTMAVMFSWTSSNSSIGLAFLNLVNFSQALTGLVVTWTMLETSLGAISRVRRFVTETAKEAREGETQSVPDGWPTAGAVTFHNAEAAYSDDLAPALHNVSMTIPAGSKVAICGRTGSGKSSTLLTLLRLLDLRPNGGTLSIDGIDLARLPRETIRRRLASLPQDPVTLPGTVRTNLAPFADAVVSDADLIAALTKAQIWPVVAERGGLDADVAGMNLSPGQRQLFALAAAAVRGSKVVLLDEATGSVDLETDRAVRQALLDGAWVGCTVIEVVHRIEMVMERYDVVVVMDEGRVVEMGAPGALLAREGSRFRELWEGRVGAAGES